MNSTKLFNGVLAFVTAVTLFTGCATQNDSLAQAEKTEKNRPGIAETKAIAEEGFIYGLPLVMNYAANYEFWVDKTSSQYKCPMNQLFNEHRVFTYKDTAVVTPNSDTPYSFVCLEQGSPPWARRSTVGTSARPSAIGNTSTVTGCSGLLPLRPGFTATTPWRLCIP